MLRERRRACALCVHENRMLLVRLRDEVANTEFWVPPGGGIEDSESVESAARREALEETGYRIRLIPEHQITVSYPFVWLGETYLTTTTFILAHLEDPGETAIKAPSREKYILEERWWAIREGLSEMSLFPEIAKACEQLLHKANIVT